MASAPPIPNDLSGAILVASPILRDPNFRKTILFVASHSSDDGAVAYVLNRPLGSHIELPSPSGPLGVELHYGGPVRPEELTLASLQWRAAQNLFAFRTFGEQDVGPEWRQGLRAFAGYAGWSPGQLEDEIEHKAWLILVPARHLIEMRDPSSAWDDIIAASPPILRLLAAAPDDPSMN